MVNHQETKNFRKVFLMQTFNIFWGKSRYLKIYTRINFKAVFHSRWIQVIMEKVWNIKLYRQWCYYHSSPKFWRINMRKLLLYLLILIIFGLFLENSDARRFQKAQPRRWRRPKNLRRLQYINTIWARGWHQKYHPQAKGWYFWWHPRAHMVIILSYCLL